MIQPKFKYKLLVANYKDFWDKSFSETGKFDELIEARIQEKTTRDSIKDVVKKIRDPKTTLVKSDLAQIKLLIKRSDDIFHASQWTANFSSDAKLKSGTLLDHIDLINKIKYSTSLNTSGLSGVFDIKIYNLHFPHLYSIIKNIQDEQAYPVFFPYWQDMYKWIDSKESCSYDDLTQFYRTFKVPASVNKYRAYGAALNVFHIEYLRWCLNTNEGYKKTEKSRRLLKKWHFENEQFLNEIHAPMQKMKFINLDTWRQLNETLFKCYIKCFQDLATGNIKIPADSMLSALEEHGIKGKVKADNYGAFYIIGRELGIFYQDNDDKYILGELAKKYVENDISYTDYLKHYILNTEFLIDGIIVHPFSEIVDVLKKGPSTLENLANNCVKCIPIKERSENATEKLNTFIKRAIDSGLVKMEGDKYSLTKDLNLIESAISKSNLDTDAFTNKFVGAGKNKQENIVKEMINRDVPPNILDGGTGNPMGGIKEKENNKYPLNQILYGPPGTGKTYSTIIKALNILGLLEEKPSYRNEEYENAQNLFQKELGKRIEFVTMHQSFSYEDFVQGLKPKKGEKGIEFDYKNGVFKEICERAWNFTEISKHTYFPSYILSLYEDLLLDSKILPNNLKTQNDRLDYFANLIDDSKSQILVKGPRDCFDRLLGDKSPRGGWTKENYKNNEHWNTCEETIVFFNLISPERCIDLIYKNWIQPAKEKIESHHKNLSEITREPYVIVLDEINRANISRVFGELIALIEKDKRDCKLTATLPSGEAFTVPSNLHIIGTMNTADKSIALVDIALRRRFKFIPLYPNKDLLEAVLNENKFDEKEIVRRVSLMTNLNKIIRSKKSVDFEIGHYYFMENDTLINILNQQILPLLNEYFMYDLRKVQEIIEQPQKDREGNKIPSLGIQLNQTIWKERGLLEVEIINDFTEEVKVVEIVENDVTEN
jgi:hypothetical protein